MKHENCPRFEGCNATLCPLASNLNNLIFFADEDICLKKEYRTLIWVKKQKAISKLKLATDKYFNVEMLKSIKRLSKGIEGIDPDLPLDKAKEAEERWILGRQNNGDKQASVKNKEDLTRTTGGGRVPRTQNTLSPKSKGEPMATKGGEK